MGLIEFEVIPVRVDKVEHGQCPFPCRPKVDLGASYLRKHARAQYQLVKDGSLHFKIKIGRLTSIAQHLYALTASRRCKLACKRLMMFCR